MTSRSLLPLLWLAISGAALAQSVLPPQVFENPAAVYPPAQHGEATVTVVVTVSEQGTVSAPEVVVSGGSADFDNAALEAVKKWKFRPALRDGVPFPARIRIPFVFQPPVATQSIALMPGADGGIPVATLPRVPPPSVVALPVAPEPEEDAGTARSLEEVSVRGHQRKVERGGSDFQIEIGQLAVVANKSASDILQLAPGVFIANEGGAGHADQVFLRGFNAEQGQDIEFTVNGVPINEVDNTDGHGYADTHFIIPELVKNLRVIEGPFDPHQGDFAVAGSAEYELGVAQRGITLEGWYGSFDSERLLAIWAPKDEREGTFAGAQFFTTQGYGSNRASSDASLMAQYEGELGQRGLYRLFVTAYATHFKSAGVIRSDDYEAGKIDFYGTEDPSQGGDAQRYSISFDLENPTSDGVIKQQAFLIFRTLRMIEDFTGFLLDPQEAGQSIHPQRGDAILQTYDAVTAGARSSYRSHTTLFGREQSMELGFYARYDHTLPEIQRLRFDTEIPYSLDSDLQTDIFNLAAYVDFELRPLSWLTLRGGFREEFMDYNVLNLCATNGIYKPGQPLNVNCPSYDLSGPRDPATRQTATGLAFEPKVTGVAKLSSRFSLTGSYGLGAESVDAQTIVQDENAPFSQLRAAEAGGLYRQQWTSLDVTGRLVGYWTHVDRDLIFDPQLGRLTQSTGTTRYGVVAAGRATTHWIDEMISATYAHASFDADGTLVPYVPIVIARSDTAVYGTLPKLRLLDRPFNGTAGLGLNFIGTRALPFSQFAAPTLEIDASASLAWHLFKLGLKIENLTDRRYALSEFFYASDFHSRPYPTLVPTEHFSAAAPRTIYLTFAITLDSEKGR